MKNTLGNGVAQLCAQEKTRLQKHPFGFMVTEPQFMSVLRLITTMVTIHGQYIARRFWRVQRSESHKKPKGSRRQNAIYRILRASCRYNGKAVNNDQNNANVLRIKTK